MGFRQTFPTLKLREPRIRVCIPTRLQNGAAWSDAFILNVSSRGLLIHTAEPAERGTYVELRRGKLTIVARVMWRSGPRAGLRSQDPIPVEALVTSGKEQAAANAAGKGPAQDRRSQRREQEHEQSRLRGRTVQFASVTIIGVTLSVAAYSIFTAAVAQPLAQVGTALSGQASLPSDSR